MVLETTRIVYCVKTFFTKPTIRSLLLTTSYYYSINNNNKKYFVEKKKNNNLVVFSDFQSEIKKTKDRLNEIYSKHTGNKINEIQKVMERDRYFSPDEAIKFGLIDKIVEKRKP